MLHTCRAIDLVARYGLALIFVNVLAEQVGLPFLRFPR
jgi:hypothetical protein